MATATLVHRDIAAALDMHPAAFGRSVAVLGAAKIITRLGQGSKGRAAHHYDARELAMIILSLAADGPSGAADAANALGKLMPDSKINGASLRTELLTSIFRCAQESLGIARPTFADASWELTLCLNPLRAWLMLPDGEIFYEGDVGKPASGIERITRIRKKVLLTAAALAADTELVQRSRAGLIAINDPQAETKNVPATIPARSKSMNERNKTNMLRRKPDAKPEPPAAKPAESADRRRNRAARAVPA